MDNGQLKKGYKQTEVGEIPEDWDYVESSFIANYFGGNSFKSKDAVSSGVRWLKIGNVGKRISTWDEVAFLPKSYMNDYEDYLLNEGDVVMALTRPILSKELKIVKLKKTDTPALLNQRVAKVMAKQGGDLYFLYHSLQATWFINAMNEAMAGTDPPNIGSRDLGKIRIPVPPTLDEQRLIATVLSDVDDLITSLDKLIAKKRAIKTATMQELLTGKKRLPGFGNNEQLTMDNGQLKKGHKQTEVGEIPEDWDEVSLGEIGYSVIGLTYNPNDVCDDGVLVLRSSNVQNGKLAFIDSVFVKMDFPERVFVKENDILICVRNGSKQLIGKCALITKQAEGCVFGAFMSVFRSNINKYLFYQFQSNIIQKQINEVMGATINQLTNKDLKVFKVALPHDEVEQSAIASILSDMDAEIEALEKRRDKTKMIKQGMMQELLTGKTRLIDTQNMGTSN